MAEPSLFQSISDYGMRVLEETQPLAYFQFKDQQKGSILEISEEDDEMSVAAPAI